MSNVDMRERIKQYPKFRSDLQIVEQSEGAAKFYVIKDPWAHRFYRLRETEYQIACQFTGRHLNEVARQLREQQGVAVGSDVLGKFAEQLASLGLLEDAYAAEESSRWDPVRPAQGWKGFRTNPMFVKFPLANPNPILGRLSAWCAPLFTRTFLFAVMLVTTVCGWLLWQHQNDLGREVSYLVTPAGLVMSVLTSCLVITFHELAHAVACRRYGGQVPDIGFALYMFQPYFYTDVGDAWLLPRAQRLAITLAGPLFEAVLWSGAVVFWLYSPAETDWHRAALTVVVGSGLKLIWNLNPLLRLDGYYLVMDLLRIPNLRTKTKAFWKQAVQDLTRGRWPSLSEPNQRLYAAYGLLSGICTLLLFGWLLRRLWTMVHWAYPTQYRWVFALLLGLPLVLGVIQAVYYRWLGTKAAELKKDADGGFSV